MAKKILIPIICVAIIGLSIFGYVKLKENSVSSTIDRYLSIPGAPYAILQVNNVKTFEESLLYNNNYWVNLTKFKTLNKVHVILSALDSIQKSDENMRSIIEGGATLALYKNETDSTDVLLTMQLSDAGNKKVGGFLKEQLPANYSVEYHSEFLLASNSQNIINEAKKSLDAKSSPLLSDSVFAIARRSAGDQHQANLFLNLEKCQPIVQNYLLESLDRVFEISHQYDSWCGYDIDLSEDKIEINGFAFCKNKDNVVSAFEGQEIGHNTLSETMPYNTFFYRHYAISDFEGFRNKLFPNSGLTESDPLETASGESPLTFFQEFFGGEIAVGRSPMDLFVLVKLNGTLDASEALDRIATDLNPDATSEVKGTYIYHIGTNGFAGSVFGDYFTLPDEYMCIVNGVLIITPSLDYTSYISKRNTSTQTLQCSPEFKGAKRALLSMSNRSIYVNIPYVTRNADKFFVSKVAGKIKSNKELWDKFDCIGLQSDYEGEKKDYHHLFISYTGEKGEFKALEEDLPSVAKAEEKGDSTANSEVASTAKPVVLSGGDITLEKGVSVTLEAQAVIKPQILKNGSILIQDKKNILYLLSANGDVIWKRSLDGQIIGGIKEVDIHKNNQTQLAFATNKKIFVIDSNGKALSGYPIKASGTICTPLAVFDYENNKDYRFAYGTTDKKVHLTKADGTPLNEWSNIKTNGKIDGEIKHFRISGKDFITYADAKQCYIRHRNGTIRLDCGNSLIKSTGNDFDYDISKMRMVLSLTNGKLCFISTSNDAKQIDLGKAYGNKHIFKKIADHYVFCTASGFDVYDSKPGLIYSDNNGGSAVEGYSNIFGVYNSKQGITLYKLSGSNATKTTVKTSSPLFTITSGKGGVTAIMANGNALEFYNVK